MLLALGSALPNYRALVSDRAFERTENIPRDPTDEGHRIQTPCFMPSGPCFVTGNRARKKWFQVHHWRVWTRCPLTKLRTFHAYVYHRYTEGFWREPRPESWKYSWKLFNSQLMAIFNKFVKYSLHLKLRFSPFKTMKNERFSSKLLFKSLVNPPLVTINFQF